MNEVTCIQPYPSVEKAMDAVRQHVSRFASNSPPIPCIALDLDDTALFSVTTKHPQTQTPEYKSFVIPAVKGLYEWCVKNGIPVVGITARPHSDTNYSMTQIELKGLGYTKLHSLHLMPELKYGGEPSVYDIATFKTSARARLRTNPHNLWPIVNIGNMPQDLTRLTPPTLYTETVRQMDENGIYGFMALNEDPFMLNIKLPDSATTTAQ